MLNIADLTAPSLVDLFLSKVTRSCVLLTVSSTELSSTLAAPNANALNIGSETTTFCVTSFLFHKILQ